MQIVPVVTQLMFAAPAVKVGVNVIPMPAPPDETVAVEVAVITPRAPIEGWVEKLVVAVQLGMPLVPAVRQLVKAPSADTHSEIADFVLFSSVIDAEARVRDV